MFYSPELFLNTDQNIEIDLNKLPHGYQKGKFQFVTFRLNDSLPAEVRHIIQIRMNRFKDKYPQPWSQQTLKEYNILFRRNEQKALDTGYGECILRIPRCREIVMEALTYYKELECYDVVIMPNHIHLLAIFEEKPKVIIGKIKHYTATKINSYLGRTGHLWQREIWDRLIRNESHLLNTRNYIHNNPRHLHPSTYTLLISGHLLNP